MWLRAPDSDSDEEEELKPVKETAVKEKAGKAGK